jgi:ubiquinone/menaquinone biosynthesis C-methylase UbiE
MEKVLNKTFLDLGCGLGNHANYLSSKNPHSAVYGIDISENNIRFAETNKISPNQTFSISKGEQLPFTDAFFNEVHCYEVLEHVFDLEQTLKEISRVLKINGNLILSVPREESELILKQYNPSYLEQIGHKRTFTKQNLFTHIENAGFEILNYSQYNAIEHLLWISIFKRGGTIQNQLGQVQLKPPFFMSMAYQLLSKDIVRDMQSSKSTAKKIALLIGLAIYPIGRLLDSFLLNKRQQIIAKKKSIGSGVGGHND